MKYGLGVLLWRWWFILLTSSDRAASFLQLLPDRCRIVQQTAFAPPQRFQALIYSPSADGGALEYAVLENDNHVIMGNELAFQQEQQQHLVAQLLSSHNSHDTMGALARLACAHAPPTLGVTLENIESVSIIGIHPQQLDIQAVIYHRGETAATLKIPVVFPARIDLADASAVEARFSDLDEKARQILEQRTRDAARAEERERVRMDLMDERTLIQFPEWWVPPRDLRQDCDSIRDLLNGADFDQELQMLAQSGVDYYHSSSSSSTHKDTWLVEHAVVATVGPAGLFMRASAASHCGGITGAKKQVFDLPLQFAAIAQNADDLRSAVLQTISSISTEVPGPQDDRQRQWEELLVLDASSCVLPDWWTDVFEPLAQEYLYAQQMLNQLEYQQGLRDLVLAGIEPSEHAWVVDMAAVAGICPTGMYLRARCLDYNREVMETVNVPVPFSVMVHDVDSLRSAVLSAVLSVNARAGERLSAVNETTTGVDTNEGTELQTPFAELQDIEGIQSSMATIDSLPETKPEQVIVVELETDARGSSASLVEKVPEELAMESTNGDKPFAGVDLVEETETDTGKQPVAFVRKPAKPDVEALDLSKNSDDEQAALIPVEAMKEYDANDSSVTSLSTDELEQHREEYSDDTEQVYSSDAVHIAAEEAVDTSQALLNFVNVSSLAASDLIVNVSSLAASDLPMVASEYAQDLASDDIVSLTSKEPALIDDLDTSVTHLSPPPPLSTNAMSRRPIRVDSAFQIAFRKLLDAVAPDL